MTRPYWWKGVGNEEASSDLYGIGVRIGLYLQGAAYLIGYICIKHIDLTVYLLGSLLAFSFLTSWNRLVDHVLISPAEAWIILLLIFSFLNPAELLILLRVFLVYRSNGRENPTRHAARQVLKSAVGGQGILFLLMAISVVWFSVSELRFWTTSIKDLPDLGTKSHAWIFHEISSLQGSLRDIMIFWSVLYLVFTIGGFFFWAVLVWAAWSWWVTSIKDGEQRQLVDKDLPFRRTEKKYWVPFILGLLLWGGSIFIIEYTISVNNLSPNNNITIAGQLLPFVSGLVSILDALILSLRAASPRPNRNKLLLSGLTRPPVGAVSASILLVAPQRLEQSVTQVRNWFGRLPNRLRGYAPLVRDGAGRQPRMTGTAPQMTGALRTADLQDIQTEYHGARWQGTAGSAVV